ncbi:MAG: fluoride efflux transporter CrcB [Deltaproteobacteria bacterium]|nr:fluoride efflux transporter CrcB [Deltaproteobacteria bacterium]
MERLVLICAGGALGTGARYLVTAWAVARFGTSFPFGTLIVNIAGCLLMGLVMQAAVLIAEFPPNLRLGLTTGFLGGLTTYSSFAFETTHLFRGSERMGAVLNFGLTTVACFAAVALGMTLARGFVGR